jgi:hypothetical protein
MSKNIQYKAKLHKRTSRIARKKASIFPFVKPLGGEVCRSTVPRTTEARYATLKVNPAIIEANTRSAARCCALQSDVKKKKSCDWGRNLRRHEQSNKKNRKSGLATNGFDKMRARVAVGSGSCACRDGDQTERTMLGNDGIRLPVTTQVQQKKSRRGGG